MVVGTKHVDKQNLSYFSRQDDTLDKKNYVKFIMSEKEIKLKYSIF
jgi:hypothetical protein